MKDEELLSHLGEVEAALSMLSGKIRAIKGRCVTRDRQAEEPRRDQPPASGDQARKDTTRPDNSTSKK